MNAPFDVFISYTRKDADFARAIAELLMANGLRIWFDEYRIPLTSAVGLRDALTQGVNQSKAAVLITNPEYVRAHVAFHEEAKPLLLRQPPIPVLNIGRPSDPETVRTLRGVAEHPGTEPKEPATFCEVITLLEKFLGVRLVHDVYSNDLVDDGRIDWRINSIPARLNVAGWQFRSGPKLVQKGDSVGPNVLQVIDGQRLDMNVTVGKTGRKRDAFREFNPEKRWEFYEWGIAMAQQYVNGWSPRMAAQWKKEITKLDSAAERAVRWLQFGVLCVGARLWSSFLGNECVGVHLFHQSGLNQFAVTYNTKMGWTRKYSILLPDPLGGSDLEFVFTGGITGDIRAFLRYAHRFDEYVGSLRYGDTTRTSAVTIKVEGKQA